MIVTIVNIIELSVIVILGISLAILTFSYQRLLREFYLFKEGVERERLKRKKIDTLEKIFEEKVKKEIEKAGESARREISETALSELKKFTVRVTEETLASQEISREEVAKEFDEAKAEIEAFKAKKMAEIANKVGAVVSDVVRKTLGRAIEPKEQEELVLKALEDAKRQNLL